MYIAYLLIAFTAGYLAGSINFAILVSGWAKGIDIRSVGNLNPGTANVGREVGKGWAALVFLGDLAKGLIPLFLARTFLFPEKELADYSGLFLTGMAAITGHCFPLYHQFRGGGGLATSIGVFMFFIPAEFFAALLVSYLVVQSFFSRKKYAFGQLVPMFFITLAPLFVLLSSVLFDTRILGRIQVGGHSWYVFGGVLLLSVYILIINIRTVLNRFLK